MRSYSWVMCCLLAVGCCVDKVCSQPSSCQINEVNIVVPVNSVKSVQVGSAGAQCLLYLCQNIGFGPTFSRHLVTCSTAYSSASCNSYSTALDREGSVCCRACDACGYISCSVANSECVVTEGQARCVCKQGFTGIGNVACTPVCDPPCSGGTCVAPNTCNICPEEQTETCNAEDIEDRCSEQGTCVGSSKQCINFANGEQMCNCVFNRTVYRTGSHLDLEKCMNCTCTANGDFTCSRVSCNCGEHNHQSIGCCPDLVCPKDGTEPEKKCLTANKDEITEGRSLSGDCETYVCLKNLTLLTMNHRVVGCPKVNCSEGQLLTLGMCCLFCAAPFKRSDAGVAWQITIALLFVAGMAVLVGAVFLYYRKRIKDLRKEYESSSAKSSSAESASDAGRKRPSHEGIKREGENRASEDSWSYRLPMDSSSSGSGIGFYDNLALLFTK